MAWMDCQIVVFCPFFFKFRLFLIYEVFPEGLKTSRNAKYNFYACWRVIVRCGEKDVQIGASCWYGGCTKDTWLYVMFQTWFPWQRGYFLCWQIKTEMIDTQFYSLSHSSRFLANNLIYVKESRAEVSKAKFRSRLLDRFFRTFFDLQYF